MLACFARPGFPKSLPLKNPRSATDQNPRTKQHQKVAGVKTRPKCELYLHRHNLQEEQEK